MREAPDIDLLHMQGHHVGVEIVRTVDRKMMSSQNVMRQLISEIQIELEANQITGAFRVIFDLAALDEMKISKRPVKSAWQTGLPSKLAAFLSSNPELTTDGVRLRSFGIDCIASVEMAPSPSVSVGYGWQTSQASQSLAEISLGKKDGKLLNYRRENGSYFYEYWLAIASLGPGTVEDGGFSMLLGKKFQTDYDRVLLIMHGPDGRFINACDVTPSKTNSI